MPPRRRAFRDHQDVRPIVGSAKAALRASEEVAARTREGLARHFESETADRPLTNYAGGAPNSSGSKSR